MKNFITIFLVLLLHSEESFAINKVWIGKGAGGSGTDFNTAANWNPVGVPLSTDGALINLTSTATITLSANTTIGSLTFTVNNGGVTAILDVKTYTFTIIGGSTVSAPSGNAGTFIKIGNTITSEAGTIDFGANILLGSSSVSGPVASFIGNSSSKFIFRKNLTLGLQAAVSTTSSPGTALFDGAGTQTITWNNTVYGVSFTNVIVGSTNNPTVVQTTGTATSNAILGNLTVNGSSILDLSTSSWNRNSAGGTLTLNGTSTLKLGNSSGGQAGSNFPLNFSSYSINVNSTVEYNSASNQTIFDVPVPGYGNLTVTNTSVKTAGNSLDVRGNVTINPNATFAGGTGYSHTVGGNWSNSGTFTAATSTVTLNGSALQNIQGASTTTFNNLIINNTSNNAGGDIILNNVNAAIAGVCTFTHGIVNSATGNILIFNDNAIASGANNYSFVNVPVKKIGNDAFNFPVGKSNVGYMYCGISAPSSVTDAFTAEYKRNSAEALGPISAPGLYRVSACEYWQLDRTTGSSSVNVTLSWSGLSPCNASAYVSNLASLVVAHFNGTSWDAYGSNFYTGNAAAGSVTWNNVSTFSPFTLGSTSAIYNPLPIKFNAVKAYSVINGNRIEWVNVTEENLARYEIERSSNGTAFNTILAVIPKTNNGQDNEYAETDKHILSGMNYYRIKAIQLNGSYDYSAIMKVNSSGDEKSTASVYPNPVLSNQFTLGLNNYTRGTYSLRLIGSSGRQVTLKTLRHSGGSVAVLIDRPVEMQGGVYLLQIIGNGKIENIKLLIK